jgi:cell division protein ZapA
MKEKAVVTIGNKQYTIVGLESQEYISKVGKYIDGKMKELIKSDSALTIEEAAILTAINVADDYFKEKENSDSLRGEVAKLMKVKK